MMGAFIKRNLKKRIWLFIVILIISLLGTAGFYIRSAAFLDWIETRLEEEIQKQVTSEYTVEIGKITGNIFRGVRIESARITQSRSEVISTGEIRLKYNFIALLHRKFVVTALHISEPRIHASVSESGTLNLAQIFRPRRPEAKSQFGFALKQVECLNGTLDFTLMQQNLEIAAEGVSLELNGPLNAWHHTGKVAIKTGHLRIGRSSRRGAEMTSDVTTTIERFQVDFLLSIQGSRLNELFLKSGNSALRMRGAYEQEKWNAEITLLLDVAQHQRLIAHFFPKTDIPSFPQLQGMALVRLWAEGTESTLNGELSVNASPLIVRHRAREESIHLANVDIDADFALTPVPSVRLNTCRIRGAGGQFAAKGHLRLRSDIEAIQDNHENRGTQPELLTRLQALTNALAIYEAEWHGTQIQLQSVFPILPGWLREVLQADVTAADLFTTGTFNGSHLLAQDEAQIGDSPHDSFLQLHGNLKLTNTVLNDVPLADSTLRCTISATEGAAAEIEVTGNLNQETELRLKGPFGETANEPLQVHFVAIDMATAIRIFNTAELGGEAEITASISHDGIAKGSVQIPDATFMNIPIGVLAGDFRYRDGRVLIENGVLSKGESRLSIDGTVDVHGELPANFRIKGAPAFQAAEYRLLFGADYPIEAVLTGELNLDGSLTHLNGRGTFNVNAGKAWGIQLNRLILPLKIENYHISIPDFKISARDEEVTLNFEMSPDGNFDLGLKSSESAPVRLTEIATAAEIPNFPIDAQIDIDVVGKKRAENPLDFRVTLNFSEITFENNPLGDAYLIGRLIEAENRINTPALFRFDGYGFEGASRIQGEISMDGENPYRFVVQSQDMPVSPILSIFHHKLNAVTGAADNIVHIRGNVGELIEPATESKRVYPYNLDITVTSTNFHYSGVDFAAASPIHLQLDNDIWTINACELTAAESPFIALTGTLPAASGPIDVRAEAEAVSLDAIGNVFGIPISGSAAYTLAARGNMAEPILEADWAIPHLSIKTEIGDVIIGDADGHIGYEKNAVIIKPFTLNVLGNEIEIEGDIKVNPEEPTTSRLNVTGYAAALDFAKFSALVRNVMPRETGQPPRSSKKATANTTKLIDGKLDVSIELSGSGTEPVMTVTAHSLQNAPIRIGPFSKPIVLDTFGAEIAVDSKFAYLRNFNAAGAIGDGAYQATGEAAFAIDTPSDVRFAIDVAAQHIEIAPFTALVWNNGDNERSNRTTTKTDTQPLKSPIHGTLSGQVMLIGTGLSPQQISITTEVSELNLSADSIHLTNRSPLRFSSTKEKLTGHLPLRFVAPETQANVDVALAGTWASPEITGGWNGTVGALNTAGQVQYQKQQLNLVKGELTSRDTDKNHTLSLNGVIPINGADNKKIELHLQVQELPLQFFPGIDRLLSHADGVVDMNVTLRGTNRLPYLEGSLSVQASLLGLKDFAEPLRNATLQLKAQKELIDITKFQFELGDGICTLERGQLSLNGLTPEKFQLSGVKLEELNLNGIFPQFFEPLSRDGFLTEGKLTTTLQELVIPLDSFFLNPIDTQDGQVIPAGIIPIPKIQEMPTLRGAAEVATGILEIEQARVAFVLPFANHQYDFRNTYPISISLNRGVIALAEGFHFEDFYIEPEDSLFPIQRPVASEKALSSADSNDFVSTVFSADEESRWELNGELDTTVRVKNFDVAPLTHQLLPEYELNGTLSGSLHIDGTVENPRITVRRNKPKNRRERDGIELNGIPLEVNGRLRYENGEWEISARRPFQVTLGENQLTFLLTLPLEFSKIMENLRAKERVGEPHLTLDTLIAATNFNGQIDVAVENPDIFAFIVPGLGAISGNGTLHVTLFGNLNSPKLDGTARFNDFGIELPQSGISLIKTTGHLEVSETQVDIPDFKGTLNGGDFSVTGSLISPAGERIWKLPPQSTIDLRAEQETSVFKQQGQYQVVIASPMLHLKGTLAKPNLTGDIHVHSGYYESNWETVRDWVTDSSEVTEAELALDYPILRDFVLDIGLNVPDNFHVLSSVGGPTDIEISCAGRLTGPIQRPIFTGNVSFLRGTVWLFTHPFEFVEGSDINNQSTATFNPELNISLNITEPLRGVPLRDGSTAELLVNVSYTGKLDDANTRMSVEALNTSTTYLPTAEEVIVLLTQRFSLSQAFSGVTFTISPFLKGRPIRAEYPLPLGKNMSIRVERDEEAGYGIDFQLEGRF